MFKGLLGKKIGMTQIFDENGTAVPITVIEAGPCYVTQLRNQETDGYTAVQLGFDEVKPGRITNAEKGHLKRNNLPPLRFLREFRVKDPQVSEGDKVTVDLFALGELVDVIGTSKGRGFAGGVKRYEVASRANLTVSAPLALMVPVPPPAVFSKVPTDLVIWAMIVLQCRT